MKQRNQMLQQESELRRGWLPTCFSAHPWVRNQRHTRLGGTDLILDPRASVARVRRVLGHCLALLPLLTMSVTRSNATVAPAIEVISAWS